MQPRPAHIQVVVDFVIDIRSIERLGLNVK